MKWTKTRKSKHMSIEMAVILFIGILALPSAFHEVKAANMVRTEAELRSALSSATSAEDIIQLDSDIVIDASTVVSEVFLLDDKDKGATIDFNGHTIRVSKDSSNSNNLNVFQISGGAYYFVNTGLAEGGIECGAGIAGISVSGSNEIGTDISSDLTLNNVSIVSADSPAVRVLGGSVSIESGLYQTNAVTGEAGVISPENAAVVNGNERNLGGILYISSGTFRSDNTTALLFNYKDSMSQSMNDTNISGGEFITVSGCSVAVAAPTSEPRENEGFEKYLATDEENNLDYVFSSYNTYSHLEGYDCLRETVFVRPGKLYYVMKGFEEMYDEYEERDLIGYFSVDASGQALATSFPTIVPDITQTNGIEYTFTGFLGEENRLLTSLDDDFSGTSNILYAQYKAKVLNEGTLGKALNISSNVVEEIELGDNIELTKPIEMVNGEKFDMKNKTIDLAGYQLNGKIDDISLITVEDGQSLVIKDSSELKEGVIWNSGTVITQKNAQIELDNLGYTLEIQGGLISSSSTSEAAIMMDSPERVHLSECKITGGAYALGTTSETAASFVQTVTANNTANNYHTTQMSDKIYSSKIISVFSDEGNSSISAIPVSPIQLELKGQTGGKQNLLIVNDGNQEVYLIGASVDANLSGILELDSSVLSAGALLFPVSEKIEEGISFRVLPSSVLGTYSGNIKIEYETQQLEAGEFIRRELLIPVTISVKSSIKVDGIQVAPKEYDGTVYAKVLSLGTVTGIQAGDDVTVEAVAVYDDGAVGEKKMLSISYQLLGKDAEKYIAPQPTVIPNASISKGTGSAEVSQKSGYVGKPLPEPVISSTTNGIKDVTIQYKRKGEPDSSYLATAPTAEGDYTVRVSFAENANYMKVVKTADFNISYRKLTISGTKIAVRKYNGETTAVVQSLGTVNGVLPGDDVTVTALAVFDDPNAGTNKKATISYSINGKDAGSYLAPETTAISDATILKAQGSAEYSQVSWYVGHKMPSPLYASTTNGTSNMTIEYKKQNEADSNYSTTAPIAAGDYTARATFAETVNYEKVVKTADFSIKYIDTPAVPYEFVGTKGENNWFTSDVKVVPPTGYRIYTQEKEQPFDELTITDSQDEFYAYLSNSMGEQTDRFLVSAIAIDRTAPSVSGEEEGIKVDEELWKELKEKIDFIHFWTSPKKVTIAASDAQSGIARTEYMIADKSFTLQQLKDTKASDWTEGDNFIIEAGTLQEQIIYAKITNRAGLTTYLASDGIVYDTTAPEITGITEKEIFADSVEINVADDYLQSVTLNGQDILFTGKSAKLTVKEDPIYEYLLVTKDITGNESKVTFEVHGTWMRDGITESGMKSLKTKKQYQLGEGQWKVAGDTTVYGGNTGFYVTETKEYDFSLIQ